VLFNVLGILDLIVAGSIGFLLFRVVEVTPSTAPLFMLPLALIPTVAVPLALVLHIVSLRRLRAAASWLRERGIPYSGEPLRESATFDRAAIEAMAEFMRYGSSTRGSRGMKRVRGGMRVTFAISAPLGDVAGLLTREKPARVRTQVASISRDMGAGCGYSLAELCSRSEDRMTLPGGAPSRTRRP
jgi:hypothetical protein